MPGACCTCDGTCSERTFKDCDDLGGRWDVEQATCSGVACPSTPLNDNCADGPPLVGEGEYPLPKTCATTDGYGPIETEFASPSQIEGDTWYKFIAPPGCQLIVSTCATYARCFDSMVAVYHNPDDPTVCPPCALISDPNGAAISSATLAGQGCDENCMGEVTPDNGFWLDWDQLGRHALPGECFLIRVGNFPGGPREVEGSLIIDCLNSPVPIEPEPSGIDKSRFISFEVPSESAGETAIRVNLTQLHRTLYYCDVCIFPFSLFEGLDMWAGPPAEYVESSSTGTPFMASMVQCTPHYRDWSTVGLLHVTGTAIVPGSTYHVEQVASACMGREEDSDCQPFGANVSGQLQIKTTRWADVVSPFNPPAVSVQPDLSDVSALVDKFRNLPGAPIKAQALLIGADGFGSIDIAPDFGFQHIATCVDAFRGQHYVHWMGRCAVGGFPCRLHTDCTWAGGAGPCELYCP